MIPFLILAAVWVSFDANNTSLRGKKMFASHTFFLLIFVISVKVVLSFLGARMLVQVKPIRGSY